MKKILILLNLFFFSIFSLAEELKKDNKKAEKIIIERLNNENDLEVKDVTKDELWEKMHLKLFKVPDIENNKNKYILVNDEIKIIFENINEENNLDYFVTDINKDKRNELIYTYIQGINMSKSLIGIYDKVQNFNLDFQYLGKIKLKLKKNGNIEVLDIDKNDARMIGTIILKKGQYKIQLKKDLPEDMLKKIKKIIKIQSQNNGN